MIVNLCKQLLVDNFFTAIFISHNTILLKPALAAFINPTRVKLVNSSYMTQQRLIPHVPNK